MSRRGSSSRIPKELRPLVGGMVLVAGVRAIDALWRGIARRPTPVTAAVPHGHPQDDGTERRTDGTDDRVGDRLLYAVLLGAALRLARRAGLPAEERKDR